MATPARFVVGIDLGTTYSAAAFALASDPRNIEVVKKWPTSGQLVGAKVPTEIAYAEDKSITWGYDINPRSRKIKWFKLGLETTEDVLSMPDGMDVVGVARDYLRELYTHVMISISRQYSASILENAQYNFVLTVPAIWSDMAKKRTELAAHGAGLGNASNSTLDLLSEPESAAVYTLRTVENFISRLKSGDRMVVCDAGGGTVDLIAYEIKQLRPLLQLEECTVGTADFCGGSFVDREFERLFQQRVGDAYGSISIMHRQQILKSFELSKMAFRDDPAQAKFYINVPMIPNMVEAGILDHQFELSREEMRHLYDPIINKILKLVQEQVSMASAGTNKIRAILLVGGFGESDYLYLRIREWAIEFGIEVLQPNDASTAVVQGAVLKGLEARAGRMIQVARRARRSYGLATKVVFINGEHLEADAEYDANTGLKIANNQIRWFIKTGELVDDEAEYRFRFQRTFSRPTVWEDSLITSALSDPSPRVSPDAHKHCTIRSDLRHLPKSEFIKERHGLRSYYVADYELIKYNSSLDNKWQHDSNNFPTWNSPNYTTFYKLWSQPRLGLSRHAERIPIVLGLALFRLMHFI